MTTLCWSLFRPNHPCHPWCLTFFHSAFYWWANPVGSNDHVSLLVLLPPDLNHYRVFSSCPNQGRSLLTSPTSNLRPVVPTLLKHKLSHVTHLLKSLLHLILLREKAKIALERPTRPHTIQHHLSELTFNKAPSCLLLLYHTSLLEQWGGQATPPWALYLCFLFKWKLLPKPSLSLSDFILS